MLQVRDGETELLAALFERHHQPLYGFFLRLTREREFSEDLVQEVFFRMLKYRHTFQPEKAFRAWMFQIARNAHFDATRKCYRGSHPEVLPESAGEPVSPDPTPDVKAGQQLEIELMEQALDQLPVEKREVLLLSQVQRLKHQEIASALGCDAGTVKVRVHRALKELREIFRNLAGE